MSERNFVTTALSWLLSRPLAIVLLIGLVITAMLGGVNSCYSRRYDKQRAEYEEKSKQWATERTTLLANAEAKEKRIAELEPKAIAFDALAEQNKRIDAGLAQQIDQISEDAAVEEAAAGEPVDCRIRWQRVCRAFNDRGIKLDCSIDRCR